MSARRGTIRKLLAGTAAAILLLAGITATAPTPGAGFSGVRRVELDRLKWAPDGNGLAVEARWIGPGGTTVDTLLFDLTHGASRPLAPRPQLFAIHDRSRRLAVADHHALWTGPIDRPTELAPLVRLDPASGDVERLGWNRDGDTLLIAVRHPVDGAVTFTACGVSDGVRRNLGRREAGPESDRYWRSLEAHDALVVTPNPLPGLYQSIGDNLFFIERTEMDTPGARGQWFFDLHHRNRFDGSERILARRMAPEALLVAPDSMWLAVPGREYRADYGGSVHHVLWLASPDGQEFFSVRPSGVREPGDVVVRALTWHEGLLWYLGDTGLFVVSPGEGRSRPVPLAPATPAWVRTLPDPARIATCRLPEIHADSLGAIRQANRLRGDGWPAWVAGPPGGPFRVAVGAANDEATLRAMLAPLPGGAGLLRDFPPEWRGAVEDGTTLPFGTVRAPGSGREAWLTAVGPPGARAGELWLNEDHGARRIRLLRASWSTAGAPPRGASR